jgi:hypothetical protein
MRPMPGLAEKERARRFALLLPLGAICLFSTCTAWPGLAAVAASAGGASAEDDSDMALITLAALASGGAANPTDTPKCNGQPFCYLVHSTINTAQNFGGAAGGDAHCAANLPGAQAGTGIYKALLMTSDGTRDQSNNWVLYANTEYRREDGTTVIGTTNASSIFTFPLTNPIAVGVSYTATGITVVNATTWNVGLNCDDWTNTAVSGGLGDALDAASNAFDAIDDACIANRRLYCVQQ